MAVYMEDEGGVGVTESHAVRQRSFFRWEGREVIHGFVKKKREASPLGQEANQRGIATQFNLVQGGGGRKSKHYQLVQVADRRGGREEFGVPFGWLPRFPCTTA